MIPEELFEHSQPMRCAQHLMTTYGYEHVVNDLFALEIDGDSALLINVLAEGFLTHGDVASDFGLAFAVARRDINEFLIEHDTQSDRASDGWKRRTISDTYSSFFSRRVYWSDDETFDSLVGEVDSLVEELPRWADLERIESELYQEPPVLMYGWHAVANSALSGDTRADELWQRFMDIQVKGLEPLHSRAELFYANTQQFIKENPNGTRH